MKKIYLVFIGLLMTSVGFGQTTIHCWDFNGTISASSPLNTNNRVTGNGTITHNIADVGSFGGSSSGVCSGSLSGNSFSPQGGTSNVNNGKNFTMAFPTTGYENIVLTFAVQKTTAGFISNQVSYSTNGTTFTNLGPTFNPPSSFALRTFDFSAIPTVNNNPNFQIRITLGGATNITGNNRYDNIKLTGTASSCTAPTTQATVYNTTAVNLTTATLNWARGDGDNVLVVMKQGSAVNADPTNGSSYAANVAFASGDQIGTGNYVVYNGPGTSVNVTGLTQNSNYHVAIYEYATTGTCYLDTELTGNFNTLCTAVSSLPFIEGFENGVPPSCWTQFTGTNGLGTFQQWQSSTDAHTGSGAAYIQWESVTGGDAEDWLVTPAINLTSTSNNKLTFYTKDGFTEEQGSIYSVRISTTSQTNIADFIELDSYTETELGNSYNLKTIDLDAYENETVVYIAFVFTQNDGDAWFLDDISIKGDCTSPTSQATSFNATDINAINGTATLNWSRGDGDNVLVVARAGSAVSTDPTSGVSYNANASFGAGDEIGTGTGNYVIYKGPAATMNLSNLTPNTSYHIAFYEFNNTSTCYNLTQLIGDFMLPCAPSALPFSEGFEGGVIPTCWAVFDNGLSTMDSWTFINTDSNSGTYSAFLQFQEGGTGTSEDWLVSAPIDLTAIPNGQLTFFTKDGDAFDYGTNYTVRISTASQMTPGDFTTVATYVEDPLAPNYIGSSFNQKTINLSGYQNEIIYIAFVMDQDLSVDGDQWYLDDIQVIAPVVEGWQIENTNQLYTIDFDTTVDNVNNGAYAGTGFTPTPSTGQLNSSAWASTGLSSSLTFGDTNISSDYTKGISTGGVTSGGFYAFEVASGNYSFGVQPTGSIFTPGTIVLRAQNQTGSTVTSISFQYTIYVNNNESRGNSFNFAYSEDNSSYMDVTSFDFTSQAAADALGWVPNTRNITINGLNIAAGAYVYMKWSSDDVSGSSGRDEFGLDDISVIFNPIAANNNSNIVTTSFDAPENIDTSLYTTASGLTTANAIKIGEFSLQDGGDTPTDADDVSTILTDLTFNVLNSGNLAALAIFDGTTNLSEVTTITATTAFTSLNIEATDDSNKVFSVYASFLPTVVDNQQIQLTISSATASLSGSGFAATDAGGAATSIAGDDNRIEVTATKLIFVQQPTNTGLNTPMSPAPTLAAVDANGNYDLDFNESISLTTTSTFDLTATTTVNAVLGVATFDNLMFTTLGTDFTISSTSSLTEATSNLFDIAILPIGIAFQSFGADGGNWNYITNPVNFNNSDGTWDIVDSSFRAFSTLPSDGSFFFGINDLANNAGGTATGEFGSLTFETVSVAGYENVVVSFDYEVEGFDNGDDMAYEYYENGVLKTATTFVEGSSNLSTTGTININATPGVNNVSFIVLVKQDGGSDYAALDNFNVTGFRKVFNGNQAGGFGGPIGTSTLEIVADSGPTINFKLNKGSGDFNDYLVIYIDSETGGIANTSTLNDAGDDGRKAISGWDGGNRSTVNFPPGFRPDFAISMNNGYAGLFKISPTGAHTFVQGANLNPTGDNNAASYTFNIDFASINATPGAESFKFLATYVNPNGAFRSNEGYGRTTSAANPGANLIEFETYFQVSSAKQGGKAPTQAAGNWTSDDSWLNGNPPLASDEITINHNTVQNIDVASNGIVVNADLDILPNYKLSTSAGITGTGTLGVSGTLSITEGGYTDITPTYTAGSTLEYKDVLATYNRFNEWQAGTAVGSGVPDNVIIDNTALDLSGLGGSATVTALNVGTNMSLLNGASLNIDASKSLTVGNILNNASGTVNMGSISTVYSSLITNSVTGSGTFNYDRHINGQVGVGVGSGANDLISAPFTDQTFGDFAGANSNLRSNLNNANQKLFGPFSKTTGTYELWDTTVNAASPLAAGVGYRAASTDNNGFTFTGTANTGTVSNNIVNSGPQFAPYNLIGNPYPSYLNVREFLEFEVATGVSNIDLMQNPTRAIYGYDGDASGTGGNGWIIYNLNTATDINLAPGQGFLVTADASNVAAYDIVFDPSMRRTDATDDFIPGRMADENNVHLKLQATIGTSNFKTDFYFNDNSTSGLDSGYDAGVFGSNAAAKSIYSHLVQDNAGVDMAIQSLAYTALGSDIIVPLGINVSQGQQVTVSIAESNLPTNIDVYLEDVVNGTFTLLNTNDYLFTPTSNLTDTGRFYLRFTDNTLSNGDYDMDKLQIYALDQTLHVNGLLNAATDVTLFDIQGRKVLSAGLESGSTNNTIDVSNMSTGVYIVKLNNTTQQKTQRVIIK